MSRLPIERFIKDGDDLVPGFDLIISGRDASKGTQLFELIRPLISSVTFEDDEDMSSILEIKVINQPDTAPGRPVDWRAVIDSKAFAEGNEIDLYMGYAGLHFFMDRTRIVKWLPVFEPGGPTQFTVKGYDGRHQMQTGNQRKNKSQRSKKRRVFYKNLGDDGIVRQIAKKYGYGADTDTPQVRKKAVVGDNGAIRYRFPTRVQTGDQSDWEFLQKLAEINRFDLWVSYESNQHVVHFKQRLDIGAAEYNFTYNGADGSLISATPDFSIHDQPTDIELLHYDRRKRKMFRTIVREQNKAEDVSLGGARIGVGQLQATKTLVQGAAVRFSAAGQVLEAFSDRPFKSKREAQSFAEHWLRERERELVIMQGTVIGVATLRSRQVHQLSGLGKRLDGFYRFTNVKHKMVAGEPYMVEFTAHKILSGEITRRATSASASG